MGKTFFGMHPARNGCRQMLAARDSWPPTRPWLTEGSRSESEIHRPGLPTVRNERCLWSLNGWVPCGSVMWFSKTGIFTAKQLTSQSRPSALTAVGRVNEYTEM